MFWKVKIENCRKFEKKHSNFTSKIVSFQNYFNRNSMFLWEPKKVVKVFNLIPISNRGKIFLQVRCNIFCYINLENRKRELLILIPFHSWVRTRISVQYITVSQPPGLEDLLTGTWNIFKRQNLLNSLQTRCFFLEKIVDIEVF